MTAKWEKDQTTRLRGDDKRQKFLDQLDDLIRGTWEDSDEVYGALRITAERAEDGVYVNRKTVAKRMRLMVLRVSHPGLLFP